MNLEKIKRYNIAEKEKNLSTIKEYLDDLGLSINDLQKKMVLDVGAGSARFARAMGTMGLDCEVYSMDLGFTPSKEDSESRKRFFQAEAEHLPILDNTFDLTISHLAVPMMVYDPERMEMAIREMVRGTKDGGEIRISPIYQIVYFPDTKTIKPTSGGWADRYLKQKVEAILNKLVNEGHKVEVDYVTHRIEDFDGKEADLELSFAIIKKVRKK